MDFSKSTNEKQVLIWNGLIYLNYENYFYYFPNITGFLFHIIFDLDHKKNKTSKINKKCTNGCVESWVTDRQRRIVDADVDLCADGSRHDFAFTSESFLNSTTFTLEAISKTIFY